MVATMLLGEKWLIASLSHESDLNMIQTNLVIK